MNQQPQHIDPKFYDHKNSPPHKVLHHTVPDDWDFRILETWNAPYWELNTDEYISPPSSLQLNCYEDGYKTAIALCQLAATQNLQQGRVIGYWSGYPNSYFTTPIVAIGITAPKEASIIAILGGPYGWTRFRCTWWFAYDYQNEPVTRVRIEYWDGNNWIQSSQNDYTALSGDTNRIAVGIRVGNYNLGLLDDTQIWVPQ